MENCQILVVICQKIISTELIRKNNAMLKANKNSEDKLPNPRLEEGCRNEEGRITKQRG